VSQKRSLGSKIALFFHLKKKQFYIYKLFYSVNLKTLKSVFETPCMYDGPFFFLYSILLNRQYTILEHPV